MTAPLILHGKVQHVAHASQWSDHLRRVAIVLDTERMVANTIILIPSAELQRGQAVTITIAVDGEDQE